MLELGNPALSLAVLDGHGKGVTTSVEKSKSDILSARQFGLREEVRSARAISKNVAASAFYLTKKYLESKGTTDSWRVEVTNSPMFGTRFKSGLGSSAASTVAVVKTLLAASGLDLRAQAETAHKLAQYSYAAYAGRVDSGFDVATCSFGSSIVYHRFQSDSITLPSNYESKEVLNCLLASLGRTWQGMRVEPVSIPKRYSIIFFNIEGAKTSTISNVNAVMKWRTGHKKQYASLVRAQGEQEALGIQSFKRGDDDGLRAQTRMARGVQRTLQRLVASEVSGFDLIEPRQLTRVIDLGEKLPGVVVGRCPGAGGWDGLAFVVDTERFEERDCSKIISAAKSHGLTLTRAKLRLV